MRVQRETAVVYRVIDRITFHGSVFLDEEGVYLALAGVIIFASGRSVAWSLQRRLEVQGRLARFLRFLDRREEWLQVPCDFCHADRGEQCQERSGHGYQPVRTHGQRKADRESWNDHVRDAGSCRLAREP